jgi:hypothetical protein
MNQTKKSPERFRPDTRFELRPAPTVPFRANLETEFEQLKNQLLAERITQAAKPEGNVTLRRAANEAAALAWISQYPLLVFPALFEEKSRAAERQTHRQARIYADSRQLVLAA